MNDQMKRIHNASMKILTETGIRINHQQVLTLVRENGIKVVGDMAHFSEDQLMNWVGKVPKEFTVYARNPQYNMKLGNGHTEFAAGYGCPTIIDIQGQKRKAVFEDYRTFLKLVHRSERFNINGGLLVQPTDLSADSSLLMVYAAILHSDKCLMGIPGHTKDIKKMMQLLAVLFGGVDALKEKPRILTLINSTSPLQLDPIALETMLVCGEYGQPLIITPGPMAGATGPITLAGNLALGNAEALAAIAITQMIQAGLPVIYGLLPTTTDMRSGCVSIGSSGCALQMVYSTRLARAYGLPSRAGGANTDAKCPSVQSGYESMLSMLGACQQNPDFMLHSAGILDSYGAMSFEQFIIDLEIIRLVEYFLSGIEIDENTLAVDLVQEIGPGGEFLTARHTLENCRTVPWNPVISLRGILPEKSNPQEVFFNNINKQLREMLSTYHMPELDIKIKNELVRCLLDFKISQNLINIVDID